MTKFSVRLALMILIIAATVISSPQDFPSSFLGHAGRNLVEVIDNGQRAETMKFIRENVSSEMLKNNSADEQLALLEKIHEQSGGLDVIRVNSENSFLEIFVRTKRGLRAEKIYLFVEKSHPDKIIDYGILPVIDPDIQDSIHWPTKKYTDRELHDVIERNVELEVKADWISGTVLVAKGDSVIFSKAYGFRDRSSKALNNRETKYNLASMGKMLTSIAIAQLVEAGKLHFNDTLSSILPEYPMKENARKITIHQLLTHTAGLRMLFDNPRYDNRKKYETHLDLVRIFADQPLLFEPGSSRQYSNEGFIVLGAIIEKVSGENYYDYMRKHVYEPAGMKNTNCFSLDDTVQNLAIGYGWFEDDPLGVNPRRPNSMFIGLMGNACGGCYSTAADLLRLSASLRNNKLLSAEMITLLASPKESKHYGYGFETDVINGKTLYGHSGGGSGTGCDMKIFLDGTYSVIVLGNYDAPAAFELCDQISQFLAYQ